MPLRSHTHDLRRSSSVIISIFPDISRRARDAYHNLQDDDIMKNIFNSGRNKNKVGMRIPAWMITDEMSYTGVIIMDAEGLARCSSDSIEKLVEDPENVNDSSPPRHDDTSIPGTRLEPRSDKESPEVEIVQEKEEETTKDTEVEPDKDTPMVDVTNIVITCSSAPKFTIETTRSSSLIKAKPIDSKVYKSFLSRITGTIKMEIYPCCERKVTEQVNKHKYHHNSNAMTMLFFLVDASVMQFKWFHILQVIRHKSIISIPEQQYQLYLAMKGDPLLQQQDIAIWKLLPMNLRRPGGECAKGRRRSELRSQYVSGESSSDKKSVEEPARIVLSCSLRITKITPLVQVVQREYLEAPALSLINQDLLYLKKGNSGPEKIVLSLHKFPAIVFNDDDIEERTSRWVNKCIKKFNPYARYGVENWKNPHAKIFYIRRHKEPVRPKEEIYSNSKIVQVIKTYWELGHEHKFITKIVAK
ncbi:hypothetical protein Tco_0985572 [Tanacetum coccineum]